MRKNLSVWDAPAIVLTALRRFARLRAPEAAASLAYYALFSLFPLLIFLVVVGSFVLEEEQVRETVFFWLANLFPAASDLIARNLDFVIARRGPAGVTAIVAMLWSGSGAFTALARNINRAWPGARPRNFLMGRLVGLVIITVLVMLLFLSLFAGAVVRWFPLVSRFLSLTNRAPFNRLWGLATANLFAPGLTFVMFLVLYRWTPNADVRWTEAAWGAATATFGWRLAVSAFTWYLSSGLVNYQLVYGTLGTVIALLFWIYLSSLVTLLGAHLGAAIALHRRAKVNRA
ncbi:MAG: YihY/virulence factor BrkB family protein [Caldilineae bacterium]|nr:MAG: YihY/virulence factor BrkB family protein [Caldilineae bacterium]